MAVEPLQARRDGVGESVGDELRWGRDELRGMRDDVSSIVDDLRTLAQKEMELARAEFGESIGLSRQSAIWAGIAAVGAALALVFAAGALMFALDTIMPAWAAALVTTLILAGVAALAGYMAMRCVKRISVVPKRTIQSVNEDVQWARNQLTSSAR